MQVRQSRPLLRTGRSTQLTSERTLIDSATEPRRFNARDNVVDSEVISTGPNGKHAKDNYDQPDPLLNRSQPLNRPIMQAKRRISGAGKIVNQNTSQTLLPTIEANLSTNPERSSSPDNSKAIHLTRATTEETTSLTSTEGVFEPTPNSFGKNGLESDEDKETTNMENMGCRKDSRQKMQ